MACRSEGTLVDTPGRKATRSGNPVGTIGNWRQRMLVVVMLLVVWAAGLDSLGATSPTYDEYEYLARGVIYLTHGDERLLLRHPLLLDILSAALPLTVPEMVVPAEDASLAAGDFHTFARVFLWQDNASRADLLIFLGRVPRLGLTLLLVAAATSWARSRFGSLAGLLALWLTALDPNILAHGRLITPDAGQTAFIFFAMWMWWRHLQAPGLARLVAAGIFLGMAQAAGFAALILYPIYLVVAVAHRWTGNRRRAIVFAAIQSLWVAAISLLVIWVIYRFSWGGPYSIPLPAPYHWRELQALLGRLGRQDLGFFHGDVYRGGRPLFFIAAMLLKTPLPLLVLACLGVATLVSRRRLLRDMALWMLPALHYAISLASTLNIGYRHLLPMMPFMAVISGAVVERCDLANPFREWRRGSRGRGALNGLLLVAVGIWQGVGMLLIHPDYLAYFNEIAGGPEGGRRWLVVSDLDWGQDLDRLATVLQKEWDQPVYLSYFGTTPPEQYGISYLQLPAWPTRGNPEIWQFHPVYPPPGLYAISVANLVGARFEDRPGMFGFFWEQSSVGQAGRSIDLYQVPQMLDPNAPPVELVASAVPMMDLPADVYETSFRTNDVHLRWSDAGKAIVVPPENGWILVPDQGRLATALASFLGESLVFRDQGSTVTGGPYALASLPAGSEVLSRLDELKGGTAVVSPGQGETPQTSAQSSRQIAFGESMTFLGILQECDTGNLMPPPCPAGSQMPRFLTAWRIDNPLLQPYSLFLHLLDEQDAIVTQHDGFNVATEMLRAGDIVVQVHQPPGIDDVSEVHWLQIGVYDPSTGARPEARAVSGEAIERVILGTLR